MGRPKGTWLEDILSQQTDACIPHGKPADSKGYGRCWYAGKNTRVHRAVWESLNGPIPEGQVIRHSCDNTGCANPRHLLSGTVAENNWDRSERGSWSSIYGEKHGRHKLTEEQVREIRANTGGKRKVALQYGVAPSTVTAIRARKIWAWLSD